MFSIKKETTFLLNNLVVSQDLTNIILDYVITPIVNDEESFGNQESFGNHEVIKIRQSCTRLGLWRITFMNANSRLQIKTRTARVSRGHFYGFYERFDYGVTFTIDKKKTYRVPLPTKLKAEFQRDEKTYTYNTTASNGNEYQIVYKSIYGGSGDPDEYEEHVVLIELLMTVDPSL